MIPNSVEVENWLLRLNFSSSFPSLVFTMHVHLLLDPWGDAFEHQFWPAGWNFDQMNIWKYLCLEGLPWGTDFEFSNWLIHLINENELKNAGLKLVKLMCSNNSTAQQIGHWKSGEDIRKKWSQKVCCKSSNSMPANLMKQYIPSTMEH